MNNLNSGENYNPNVTVNRKRKLEEVSVFNKKPRLPGESVNQYLFPDNWNTNTQNPSYYPSAPKPRKSPVEKLIGSGDRYAQAEPKRYSANERLKQIRRSIEAAKMCPEPSTSTNTREHPKYIPQVSSNVTYKPTITAKPASLEERIKSIRGSINVPSKGYTTSENVTCTQTSDLNVSAETAISFSGNNALSNCLNDSSDSMDWSYIEEKKVLTRINEIRSEEIFTRVTPTTPFQDTLAKEFMDIPNNETILKEIYIVIDTNVFISHLDVIKNLLDVKVNGVASPIILIPWIVIQELDYLKDCKTDSKVKKKSQTAISFINSNLLAKHPRLKGQSIRDAAQQKFSGKNADDAILNCCLQVIEKQNRAMLLSNDVNLRNKAMISTVSAYSHMEIMNALDPYRGSKKNFEDGKRQDIEKCFQNLFSFVIFTKLKESYGIALNKMQPELRNPPWPLMKCLTLFHRFWQPIFSMAVQKQFFYKIGQFVEFLNKEGPLDTYCPMKLKVFVEHGLAVCIYIKEGMPMYEESVLDCINTVDNIAKTLSLPETYIPELKVYGTP